MASAGIPSMYSVHGCYVGRYRSICISAATNIGRVIQTGRWTLPSARWYARLSISRVTSPQGSCIDRDFAAARADSVAHTPEAIHTRMYGNCAAQA